MTRAEELYRQDVERRPLYHDGTKRPAWDALGEPARWSWEKFARQHPTGTLDEIDPPRDRP